MYANKRLLSRFTYKTLIYMYYVGIIGVLFLILSRKTIYIYTRVFVRVFLPPYPRHARTNAHTFRRFLWAPHRHATDAGPANHRGPTDE